MSKFWDFEKAKEYVNKLELKSSREWHKWCEESRPDFIPCSPHQVYRLEWISYMDWLGYEKVIYKRKKYSINEDFFETWSHDMAYVLGFWWADGCIHKGLFSISQSLKDRYILEDIAKVMNFDGPIKEYNGKYGSLNIYCRNLVESVKALGGTENKSLTCSLPDIPEEFFPDFVRGYFDGDGSVFILKNGSTLSNFTSGSEKFSMEFCEMINLFILNLGAKRYKEKKNYFNIRISSNGTRLLREFMYSTPSGIFLKRKKIKLDNAGEIKILKRGFKDFKKAKELVHSLSIKSKTHWMLYWKMNKKPIDIPMSPNRTYSEDWQGWQDWLGYKDVRKKGELL